MAKLWPLDTVRGIPRKELQDKMWNGKYLETPRTRDGEVKLISIELPLYLCNVAAEYITIYAVFRLDKYVLFGFCADVVAQCEYNNTLGADTFRNALLMS